MSSKRVWVLRHQSWEGMRLLLVTPELALAQQYALEDLQRRGPGSYAIEIQKPGEWRYTHVSVVLDAATIAEMIGRLRWTHENYGPHHWALRVPERDREAYPTWSGVVGDYKIDAVEYREGAEA